MSNVYKPRSLMIEWVLVDGSKCGRIDYMGYIILRGVLTIIFPFLAL